MKTRPLHIIFISLFLMASPPSLATKKFLLLDSMGQAGKPETESLGFVRVRPISTGSLWPKGGDLSMPDFPTIEEAIKKYPNSLNIICLDIEHWSTSTTDDEELAESLKKYISVANFVSSTFPGKKMGFYSMVPTREYNAIAHNKTTELKIWHQQNIKLTPLAESVDIIFPSLYAFYDDVEKWVEYAIANIEQARQYGKPVIAFLWPQIHPSNSQQGYEFVGYEFWQTQLETAYQYADGVALWTPWGHKKTAFDPSSEWWKATLDFIHKHNLNKNLESSKRPLPPIVQ